MNMQAYSEVQDALSDTPGETENMKIRSSLMTAINDHLKKSDGAQAEKAKKLGITRPRLNDLLKGHISKFSLDALVTIAVSAGLKVSVHTEAA